MWYWFWNEYGWAWVLLALCFSPLVYVFVMELLPERDDIPRGPFL